MRSLPSRGVWIEMFSKTIGGLILKSRSPRGECGLKYFVLYFVLQSCWSLPSRGVWIEIFKLCAASSTSPVAPLAGSVD